MALESAAREMEWSRSRMYRVEAGQVSVRSYEVMAMCALYGIGEDYRAALVSLAREGKSKGWWHAYGDVVPTWFELYVGLEAAANRLRHYATTLVPGLLQTPDYAAAVFRTRPDATDETVAQAVALRMERQQLLARRRPTAPKLEVIIDEAVLRRAIPDEQGMANQLSAFAAANTQAGIELRVLPSTAWPHRASNASDFVILDFPSQGTRPAEPTTVYSENLTGALYLDKPAEVAAHESVWEDLRGLALDTEDTADLLARLTKEYECVT